MNASSETSTTGNTQRIPAGEGGVVDEARRVSRRRIHLRYRILAALLAWLIGPTTYAHEIRLGYLMIHQRGTDTYDVLWKMPGNVLGQRPDIRVRFPDHTHPLTETVRFPDAGDYVERWQVQCPGGLDGKEVVLDGLSEAGIAVLVRVEQAGGATQTIRVQPRAPGFRIEAVPSGWTVSATYLRLGIEHILLGVDHLLFVLSLVLLVKGWKRIIGTVTAFTVAHSLTLAAATLGFVHVPGPPVEACIALSIVFVAAEIIREREGRAGLTTRLPWVVAFTFGLMHGLGFASALRDVGLPAHAIPLALLFFNIGVELGQIVFIGAILGVAVTSRWLPARVSRWFWQAAPYGIGSVAMFWVIDRVAAFPWGS